MCEFVFLYHAVGYRTWQVSGVGFFFVELLLFVHTKKNTFLHTPETNPEPKTVALLTKKLAMCETIHKCSRLALCVEQMTHGC